MANLPTEEMDDVWRDVMEAFSTLYLPIPVSKQAFRGFLEGIDGILDDAELEIVQLVPVGPLRDWLIDNAEIGRRIVEYIMKRRREVL